MEQKKILWVVLSIALFSTIIFGVAIYLYAPFRNSSIMTANEVADLGTVQTEDILVDPIQWTRDPESIPDVNHEDSTPVNIQNNITVVNGETVAETKGDNKNEVVKNSVNVEDLTQNKEQEKETAKLPENLAKEINPNGKNSSKTQNNTAKEVRPKKIVTGVIAKKGSLAKSNNKKTVAKKSSASKISVQKKLPSRSATKASKTQTQVSKKTINTIYWVQTASLSSRLNAENARTKLNAKHMNAEIFTKETAMGITHRVRVGPFKNKTEAEYWLKQIKDIRGFEKSYVSQDRNKK